jgi:hypothetical protein
MKEIDLFEKFVANYPEKSGFGFLDNFALCKR